MAQTANTTLTRTSCQTSAASLPHFVEYENSTYGIKICYPPTWDLQDNTTDHYLNVHVVEFHYSDCATCYPSKLVINVENVSKTLNLDDYIADSIQAKRLDDYYNFTLLHTSNSFNFAGLPGYDIEYAWSCCGFSNKLLDHEMGTIVGNKAYFVVYSAQTEKYSLHLAEINKMIDSLQINFPQLNVTQGLQQQPVNSNVPEI